MHTNRLAHEKSPYLQQHAHNPVDWYPWGLEAFEKARREDKPIFLSVGYSTCHWCHVMERESFENDEVAAVLNRDFVPVKVDREERPDVDRIYMTFVQASTGSGGWPMSVFLTPDLKPFFGGTYFPPGNQYGRPGFRALLGILAEKWGSDRPRILESSAQVVGQLQRLTEFRPGKGGPPAEEVFRDAFMMFRRTFDRDHGGFGSAPKFPRPAVLHYLMRYHFATGQEEARDMVLVTLQAMAEGGMNDQLGKGFHRYSVDERWFVPHFEKMLYDQAQLAPAYLEAYQLTGDELYAQVARDIYQYVLRDMTSPEGGFYSAEDADSVIDPAQPQRKGEGAFYVWSQAELEAQLGETASRAFLYRYGVEQEGNVHDDPHHEFTGRNILYQARTVAETAEHLSVPEEDVHRTLEESCRRLLEARSSRVRPHLDDKILTAWNGLMISAFARGAQVLGEEQYREAAVRAAEFVLTRLGGPQPATLLRRFREGEAAIEGFLDDYAFFVQGLLDLYEATFDVRYLRHALALTQTQRTLFEDPSGGFFSTPQNSTDLVLRMKEDYDGAEPAGNSVAVLNLFRLAHLTRSADLRSAADHAVSAYSSRLAEQPTSAPQLLAAALFGRGPVREVVIAGDPNLPATRALIAVARERFAPHQVTLAIASPEAGRQLSELSPSASLLVDQPDVPRGYVCQNFSCQLPVSDPEQFRRLLQ